MNAPPDDRTADAIDYIDIRRLQDAYADIVSRRQWHELDEVFRDDTVLDLDLRERTLRFVGPRAIGAFIGESVSQFDFFQFVILGTRVETRVGGDPDAAAARMYMTELRNTPAGHWSQIYGVYHDRFARVDGRWWFTHRTDHSLARYNMPASVFDFPSHLSLDSLP